MSVSWDMIRLVLSLQKHKLIMLGVVVWMGEFGFYTEVVRFSRLC